MKIALSVAFAALALPAVADDIASCAAIDADLDRLSCYDKASGRTPAAIMIPTESKWRVSKRESDFEDTTDIFLSVTSDAPIECGRIRSAVPATLHMRCMENTTALYIATECHLTSSNYNDYGDVDVRLDDAPAKVVAMDASTSNDSLGLWSGGRAIPFIKEMIGKDTMLVRFTPFSESPVTARFPISGLDEAVKQLRESCGW